MSAKHDEFFNELKQAVEEDKLVLPSLPEVALKIREVVEDENTTAHQVADILSQDGSLSARLLQVVNSPLYRTKNAIDDLQMAVTRMGSQLVRDIVINLAMKQMFQPTSVAMDKQFRSVWSTSVNTAAICQMMSTTVPGIRKEQALLAGLIHNIGALPILLIAEQDHKLFYDEVALSSLMIELQGRVGAMILESWNFSDELIKVVSDCHNLTYSHDGDADLVDLVQFSLLQGGFVPQHLVPDDLSLVPAFSKLNIDVEINVLESEENQEMVEEAKQSLML